MWDKRIFQLFFGHGALGIPKTAIITNINPIFLGIKELGRKRDERVGFYASAKIAFENENEVFLVKITTGNVIIDVTKLLCEFCENILFFGIAGSLNRDLDIGSIVSPSIFKYMNAQDILTAETGFSIKQTSGLLHCDSYYKQLVSENIDLVDMESYDFMSECVKHKVNCKYVVQVSDAPLWQPFYNVEPRKINIINMLSSGGVRI